ncbi:MAG: hypothetical protein GQ574_23395 [Crocinitomix sp.]|nr:hypothetical protein [Crocinitomix sp.]
MRIVLLFLFVMFLQDGITQQVGPFSMSLSPRTGLLMAHRETMHHLVKGRANALELEFSRQDTSKGAYSQIYRYPSRGGSFVLQDYGNREVLGTSLTFFRFTKFPIYQSKKWGFIDFRLGQGLSYITEKYDQHGNKKNIAIGSHINGFVNLNFSWTKHFNKFFVGAGIDFSHISNASLKSPNQGLNTLTTFATLGYNFYERQVYDQPKFSLDSIDTVRKFSKWHFQFVFSLKQNVADHLQPRNFGVAALQALYRKRLSPVWDVEYGIDLVYNEANRWFYDVQPEPVYEGFLIGGYSGLSLSVYKTQIYFGVGVYALNLINPAGWVYNRTGIRFKGDGPWDFSIGIKAHIGVADYLEWGLGYSL